MTATLNLLRSGGLRAAGLNEVVATADAPKGSLYHYFPNGKLELVGEALQNYSIFVLDRHRACFEQTNTPEQGVLAIFADAGKRMTATKFKQSCAVGAVLLDLGIEDETLRSLCESILSSWVAHLASRLTTLPPQRRKRCAQVIVSTLEGAQICARAQRSVLALSQSGQAMVAYMNTLSKKESK